jgi:1,4-dihydroxy-2-naphthoyl-CoA hydrolase
MAPRVNDGRNRNASMAPKPPQWRQRGSMQPSDWLLLCRRVRFGDTDAAGVMHFHQLLRWCHEAYEESLERFGIDAAAIFPTLETSATSSPGVALPITHCSADYFRPLICGDPLLIQLRPLRLEADSFEVSYRFRRNGASPGTKEEVARGLTRHRSIDASSRKPCVLPPAMQRWLEASENAFAREQPEERSRNSLND